MSWFYTKIGRASKLAEVVKQQFADTGGCPKETAEEVAKNAFGDIAEILCKSFKGDPVVRIEASGSAWNEDGKAHSQAALFKFETLGDFVE
jgi:hypothetical protein